MSSVDPVVGILGGLDRPVQPRPEFAETLLSRLVEELGDSVQAPAPKPWRARLQLPRMRSRKHATWRPRRVLVLVALIVLTFVLMAAVAYALGYPLIQFSSAPHAPQPVIKEFSSLPLGAPPGMDPRVTARETRLVGKIEGHTLWVAPTKPGGLCTSGPRPRAAATLWDVHSALPGRPARRHRLPSHRSRASRASLTHAGWTRSRSKPTTTRRFIRNWSGFRRRSTPASTTTAPPGPGDRIGGRANGGRGRGTRVSARWCGARAAPCRSFEAGSSSRDSDGRGRGGPGQRLPRPRAAARGSSSETRSSRSRRVFQRVMNTRWAAGSTSTGSEGSAFSLVNAARPPSGSSTATEAFALFPAPTASSSKSSSRRTPLERWASSTRTVSCRSTPVSAYHNRGRSSPARGLERHRGPWEAALDLVGSDP